MKIKVTFFETRLKLYIKEIALLQTRLKCSVWESIVAVCLKGTTPQNTTHTIIYILFSTRIRNKINFY